MSTQLTPRGKKGCIGCSVAFVLLVVLLVRAANAPEGADNAARHVGSRGVIRSDGQGYVYVATTKEAHDALIKAAVANDLVGIRQLMAGGSAGMVPDGTQVLVIDQGMYVRQVRFESGNLTGQTAWVAYEDIQAR